MAVDLQKIRERAAEEEARAALRGSSGFTYWSPKSGGNKIRLLPPWTTEGKNRDSFFRQINVHFGVGQEDKQRPFACTAKTPDSTRGTCPICDFVKALRDGGSPAEQEQAENIRAKQRFYSNIVDLSDPVHTEKDLAEWKARQDIPTRECPFAVGDTKVQVFTYGPQIWNDLMAIFLDANVDITDIETGRDVNIKREGEGMRTKYSARPSLSASAFKVIGKKTVAELTINLDNVLPFAPDEAMSEAVQQMALSDGSNVHAPVAAPPAVRGALSVNPALQQRPKAQLPKAVTEAAVTEAAVAEEPPPCYQDLKTVNASDAECTGGDKEGDHYDACPFFQPCAEARAAAEKPKPARGRRAATPAQADSVDALEAEMRNSLK